MDYLREMGRQGKGRQTWIVWSYPEPIAEIPKIKGLLSFYNEKVDIYVDGELEAISDSPFA